MKKSAEAFLNLLYPRHCPLCHNILRDQGSLVCPECTERLHPIAGARCMKCGKPVGETEEYCEDCTAHRNSYDQGRGIFVYDSVMRRSMVRYKYYGCREYGDFYGAALWQFGRKELARWRPDRIVPVPMYWRKQRKRGFNQSRYLAEVLGRYAGIPVDGDLVKKIRSTGSQKKLNRSERQRNLKEAFRVEGDAAGLRILLVDDVYTTGSTMDALASCLKEKGAERIFFLTVCIGRGKT